MSSVDDYEPRDGEEDAPGDGEFEEQAAPSRPETKPEALSARQSGKRPVVKYGGTSKDSRAAIAAPEEFTRANGTKAGGADSLADSEERNKYHKKATRISNKDGIVQGRHRDTQGMVATKSTTRAAATAAGEVKRSTQQYGRVRKDAKRGFDIPPGGAPPPTDSATLSDAFLAIKEAPGASFYDVHESSEDEATRDMDARAGQVERREEYQAAVAPPITTAARSGRRRPGVQATLDLQHIERQVSRLQLASPYAQEALGAMQVFIASHIAYVEAEAEEGREAVWKTK